MSNVFLQNFPNKLAASIKKVLGSPSAIDSRINFWISMRDRVRNLMRQKSYNSANDVSVDIVTDFSTFTQVFNINENGSCIKSNNR